MIAFDSEGNELHGLYVCKANTCLHDDDDGLWIRKKSRDTATRRAWVDGFKRKGPRAIIFTVAPRLSNLRISDDGEVLDDSNTMSAEAVDEAFRAFVASLPPYAHAWSDGCRGAIIDAETGLIERCDDCARFDSDLEAIAFLQGALRLKQNGVWE